MQFLDDNWHYVLSEHLVERLLEIMRSFLEWIGNVFPLREGDSNLSNADLCSLLVRSMV